MPANSTPTLITGRTAAADIGQFAPIKSDGTLAPAGSEIIGFTQSSAKAGARVSVAVDGSSIAWAGAAIPNGCLLQVGSNGTVIPYAGGIVVGRALNAANVGDNVEVLLAAAGASVPLSKMTTAYRKAAQAALTKSALIQAPLWASGATVNSGEYRRLSSGLLLYCVATGVTGATEPTYSVTAAITDNTVTWLATCQMSKLNADGYPVPTVTATTTITGLSETRLDTNVALFPSLTCPNVFASSGVTTKAWAFNDGGSSDTQGLGVGLHGYNRVTEFRTDAPKVGIGVWNNAGGRYRVYVDDYLVEENPTAFITGNPSFVVFDFNGNRKMRTWRVEHPAVSNLRSIAIDSQSKVYSAPQMGPLGVWLSDSYGGTVSSYSQQTYDYLSEMAARRLGIRYLRNYHLGGTGYQTPGGYVAVPALLDLNVPTDGQNVGYVFVAHGYNDRVYSTSGTQTAALLSFQKLRAQYPNAFIVVFGPWCGATGPDSNVTGTDSAVAAAFAQWGDTQSAFISIAQNSAGAWITGTGKWGATTGTGNSDIYTGADGTHPTLPGKDYLLHRIMDAADSVLALNGR